MAECSECGTASPEEDLIDIRGQLVCGNCKEAVVQKYKENVAEEDALNPDRKSVDRHSLAVVAISVLSLWALINIFYYGSQAINFLIVAIDGGAINISDFKDQLSIVSLLFIGLQVLLAVFLFRYRHTIAKHIFIRSDVADVTAPDNSGHAYFIQIASAILGLYLIVMEVPSLVFNIVWAIKQAELNQAMQLGVEWAYVQPIQNLVFVLIGIYLFFGSRQILNFWLRLQKRDPRKEA